MSQPQPRRDTRCTRFAGRPRCGGGKDRRLFRPAPMRRGGLAARKRGGVALEAEPQLEDTPLALGERVERLADALLAERLLGLVERVGGVAVGEQVAELALVVGADALVQRDGGLGGRERLVHVLDREPGRLGELLARRVAPELDLEPAGGATELLLA